MTNPLYMLEYLEYAGVDTKPLKNEQAIEQAYLRHIYRVDPRDKIIDHMGKLIGKSSYPRHLH